MATYTMTGNCEHLMAMTIDPDAYQHPLLSLCGREVRVWDRNHYPARLILARVDGTAPWWNAPRRGPSCPECIAALRAAKARGDASTSGYDMTQTVGTIAYITIDTFNAATSAWEVVERETTTDQTLTAADLDAKEAAELAGAAPGTLTRVTLRDEDNHILAVTEAYEMDEQ